MRTTMLIIILSMLITSGCTVKKKLTKEISHDSITVRDDSVHIKYTEKIRDSIVYVPADSALIRAFLECDSMGEVHIKEIVDLRAGIRTKPKVKIVDNYIEVECEVDSFQVYLQWKDRYEKVYVETNDQVKVDSSTNVEEKIVKKRLPWWIWVIGALAVVFIGVRLYKKLLL